MKQLKYDASMFKAKKKFHAKQLLMLRSSYKNIKSKLQLWSLLTRNLP